MGAYWSENVIIFLCVSNHWASSSTATFAIEFWSFLNYLGVIFQCFQQFSRVHNQHSVGRLLFNCRINVFIICVVNKWNWNRDCKKISIHARSLSILLAKFVNSADYVSHNEISNIFLPNVEIMRFGWYFWKYYLIKWKIWHK